MKRKELINLFKKSMEEVSKGTGIPLHEIKRDDYVRFTVDNDVKRLSKRGLNDLGGFSDASKMYFPKPGPTKEELRQQEADAISESYLNYVKSYGITPTLKVIKSWGYTSAKITNLFGSVKGLYSSCSEMYPEVFRDLINDEIFTEKAYKELKKKASNYKKFFITTAVSGKEVEPRCLESLKNFCKVENAMPIILPCEDVASRGSIFDYELDSRLKGFGFAFKDLYLNEKFLISSIKVSAKQINPLTGLDRLAQAKGSMALASPKQYLSFIANSNVKLPKALMTTGAITVPDYSSDKSMSKRTSYLAEFDHVLGGIVVEIQDSGMFHFRQIQFDKDGSFFDLGWRYNSDGTVDDIADLIEAGMESPVCVFGDTHVGSHCLKVDECLKEIVDYVKAEEIVVHDLFDNRFNNHHDMSKPVLRGVISKQGKSSLMEEGKITCDWLNDWSDLVSKITVVKSNHDEALERYIDEGRWKDDPENLYDSLDLVKVRMEGQDPLKYLLFNKIGLNSPDKVNWLKRDEDYVVFDIENGAHGDKGGNGSRGSLRSIEKAYHKATVGHSHTAGILRQVYQVGTSTHLKLSYNSGPSSWTNTMCIQYPNGQRQLITIVKKGKKASWTTIK